MPQDLTTSPWLNEPNEIDFVAHGLDCAMRRAGSLHWCGYVRVPKEHPLYGKSYEAEIEPLDVHGGLTWANSSIARREQSLHDWWFGFDCAHADDLIPKYPYKNHGTYRDATYVRQQCERLAKQLAEWPAL